MKQFYLRMKERTAGLLSAGEERLVSLERHKLVRTGIFALVLAVIGATVFLLNLHTPLNVDDYDFFYSWATGDFISGIGDVIRSQQVYYNTWGGRTINHSNLQLMLYLGKDVFNVVNTVMYLLLLLEIYYIARAGKKDDGFQWLLLIIAHLVLMTMVPFFGVTCLWATGACNYLWGTVLALMPLSVLRSVREGGMLSKSRIAAVLCVPIGLIAGWTNENITCGMIAVVFLTNIFDALEGRKVHKRLWAMWAAQCVGAVIMLAAPGNGARADTISTLSPVLEFAKRFINITAYGASYLGVLFAVAAGLSAGLKGVQSRRGYAFMLVFGALISSYAMMGSPFLADRTFISSVALMIAAVLVLLADQMERMPSAGAARLLVLAPLMMVMVYTGYHAIKDVKEYETQWNQVVAVIEEAVSEGKEEVVVPSIKSHSRFTVDTLIMEDPDLWPNSTMRKYYGIRIIGE